MVAFVNRGSSQTGSTGACFLRWLGMATSQWHAWKHRHGKDYATKPERRRMTQAAISSHAK